MNFFRLNIIIYFVLFYSVCSGQSLRRPVAAPYTGMGAYSIHHIDVFSFSSNQACLARINNNSAAVYSERRFMIRELSLYRAAIAVLTSSGNFGVQAGYFGYNGFNETQFSLAYGRKLGNDADAGVQFNYNGIGITGYGNSSAISFEMGTIFHLTENLHAGVQACNPRLGKLRRNGTEKPAAVYKCGIGFEASEKFFVSTEIEKEENQPMNINAGFQYKLIMQLMLRAGFMSTTPGVYFGVGYFLKSFRFDAVAGYHPYTGI